MTALIAQTKGGILRKSLDELINQNRIFDECDERIVAFEDEARTLEKADRAEAYFLRAAAAGLTGNYGTMRQRFQIALNNGASPDHRGNYSLVLSHLGFYSESAAMLNSCWQQSSYLTNCFDRSVLNFQFFTGSAIYARIRSAKMDISEEVEMNGQLAEKMSDLFTQLRLSDDDVMAVLDVAGSVMRNHKICSTDTRSIGASPSDGDEMIVCGSIVVDSTYEEASEMNFELACALAEKPIYSLTDRLVIRFIGSRDE